MGWCQGLSFAVSSHPTAAEASWFLMLQRELAGSFPSRKAGCDQGRARGAGPSGTFRRAGNVLGVTATCHPLGSPVLLGMERPTGEEVQDPRAGT